jgi:hypothetical protein
MGEEWRKDGGKMGERWGGVEMEGKVSLMMIDDTSCWNNLT